LRSSEESQPAKQKERRLQGLTRSSKIPEKFLREIRKATSRPRDEVEILKIFTRQIYTEPGIDYPLSHVFQQRIGEILSGLVHPSEEFRRTYGSDFRIIFKLSAKRDISFPEIIDPKVYKKTKDVEYSIFIPHDGSDVNKLDDYTKPIHNFLLDVSSALERLKLNADEVKNNIDSIVKEITLDPAILKKRSPPI
jgi:hypothetical protein